MPGGRDDTSNTRPQANGKQRQTGDWTPSQGWDAWMEELDLLRWVPRPVFVRPEGLGSLGSDSFFVEPYKILSPHRVSVGSDVRVDERSFLSVAPQALEGGDDPGLRIGDGVRIGSDVHISSAAGVEIGERTGLSVRVYIGDSDAAYTGEGPPPPESSSDVPTPIRIGPEVIIGQGAAILSGVAVGRRAFIGAGSVVTRDVPPCSVVFGNPARVLKRWDEEAAEWRIGA